jgi:hypothetical protein
LEYFAFETFLVSTHHSGENVVCARIHATSWRLPPLRQQSNFKRLPLGDEEALRMATASLVKLLYPL